MIGVGINENVVIAKAVINDKGRLELEFSYAPKGEKKSVFDTLLTARTAEEPANSTRLQIFGPLLPKKEDQTREQKIQLVAGDITKLIKQLSQILEQYMLADQIDLDRMDIQFANTGIVDAASFESRILDQDVLDRIYSNIVKRFAELITPYTAGKGEAFRLKLVRQSKDKHYATLPSRYLSDNPFIELMSVPADQSRVKFTKWELENGFDSGKPVEKEAAAEEKKAEAVEANPFAAQ